MQSGGADFSGVQVAVQILLPRQFTNKAPLLQPQDDNFENTTRTRLQPYEFDFHNFELVGLNRAFEKTRTMLQAVETAARQYAVSAR